VIDIIEVTVKTAIGIIALAAGTQGWALRRTTAVERTLLILAGLLLVFPSLIEAGAEAVIGRDIDYTEALGIAIGLFVLAKQWWETRRAVGAAPPA
jgi:TRAP-type uncharacterized transport system fused permease subunit